MMLSVRSLFPIHRADSEPQSFGGFTEMSQQISTQDKASPSSSSSLYLSLENSSHERIQYYYHYSL